MQKAAEYMLYPSPARTAGWGQDNPTPCFMPHWNKQWINGNNPATANVFRALVTAKCFVSAGEAKRGRFKGEYLRSAPASCQVHVSWGGDFRSGSYPHHVQHNDQKLKLHPKRRHRFLYFWAVAT